MLYIQYVLAVETFSGIRNIKMLFFILLNLVKRTREQGYDTTSCLEIFSRMRNIFYLLFSIDVVVEADVPNL